MQDLTKGSVNKHVINMAIPIAIGMVVQTIYYLVDLYFVGQLGKVALAGINGAPISGRCTRTWCIHTHLDVHYCAHASTDMRLV